MLSKSDQFGVWSCLWWIYFWFHCINSFGFENFGVCFWFDCPRVPAILCQYAYLLCHVRSDQHTCESGAKLDVKVAFASLWALSFLVMLTCKGIHTTIVWICNGNFFLSCKNTGCFWIRKFSSRAFNSGKTVSVDYKFLTCFCQYWAGSIPSNSTLKTEELSQSWTALELSVSLGYNVAADTFYSHFEPSV